jgi:hypothetical protein
MLTYNFDFDLKNEAVGREAPFRKDLSPEADK